MFRLLSVSKVWVFGWFVLVSFSSFVCLFFFGLVWILRWFVCVFIFNDVCYHEPSCVCPFFSGGSDQILQSLYPWFVSAIKRRFFYKKTISLRCALPLSVCILRVLCWCTTVFFKNILKEIYGESTKKGLLAPTAICRSSTPPLCDHTVV